MLLVSGDSQLVLLQIHPFWMLNTLWDIAFLICCLMLSFAYRCAECRRECHLRIGQKESQKLFVFGPSLLQINDIIDQQLGINQDN